MKVLVVLFIALIYFYLFFKHKRMLKYLPISKKKFYNLYYKINETSSKYTLYLLYLKIIATILIIISTSVLLYLNVEYIMLLILLSLFLIPFVLVWNIDFQLSNAEFNNLYIYLTQFILIFKTHNKILFTLKELNEGIDGKLKVIINDVIALIESGESIQESLKLITDMYPHFIVYNLHSLVIGVEMYGHEDYNNAIDLIHEDIDDWSEDISAYNIRKKDIINKVSFLICFAFIICFIALKMLFSVSLNTDAETYQLAIFSFTFIQMLTFTITQSILSYSFIHKSEVVC